MRRAFVIASFARPRRRQGEGTVTAPYDVLEPRGAGPRRVPAGQVLRARARGAETVSGHSGNTPSRIVGIIESPRFPELPIPPRPARCAQATTAGRFYPSFRRRRATQRFVDADKVVPRRLERNHVTVILEFLGKGIGQPSKPSHAQPHRQIVTLHIGRADMR
jgi:hypothetical protein